MNEIKTPKGCSYVETVVCGGQMVNVFLDDYGQSYYIQFMADGEIREEGCGTYSLEYLDYIEYRFDYDSWFSKQPEWYQEMIIEGKKEKEKRLKLKK